MANCDDIYLQWRISTFDRHEYRHVKAFTSRGLGTNCQNTSDIPAQLEEGGNYDMLRKVESNDRNKLSHILNMNGENLKLVSPRHVLTVYRNEKQQ